MNLKELAMDWWNQLGSASKTQLCDTNTDIITGSTRRWETLTIDEVVTLYNNIVVIKHKVNLTDEQIDNIINELNDYCEAEDRYSLGLPMCYMDNMRAIIRTAINEK